MKSRHGRDNIGLTEVSELRHAHILLEIVAGQIYRMSVNSFYAVEANRIRPNLAGPSSFERVIVTPSTAPFW